MMNSRKITISIGIPAHNEEANIGYLLKSFLVQDEENFKLKEIIVISDGSTDKTASEIKKIKDKRIRLIDDNLRLGQNKRLNQIKSLVSKYSKALLLFEADSHLNNKHFISNLVRGIPSDSNYSFISATTKMLPSYSLFGKIMDYGFDLRKKIFTNTEESLNLYKMSSVKLISSKFLSKFKWSEGLHEDSYLFREARLSNLPILISDKAVIYYKSSENPADYFTQSSKYQKAMKKEDRYSDIYKPKLIWKKVFLTLLLEAVKNPLYFTSYFSFAVLSRIYAKFTKEYTVFWKQYSSTKNLIRKNNPSPINVYLKK